MAKARRAGAVARCSAAEPEMRAPVMPSGWPSAMAPPLGFTRGSSSAMPNRRRVARPWEAKASFNSIRSKSLCASPKRAISFCAAGAGPMPMMRGATPAVAPPSTRAMGVSPWRLAAEAEARISPAAPSFTPAALPAVTVPPLRKGVSRRESASIDVARGCSSWATSIGGPLRCGKETGVISAARRPLACAAAALVWLRRAKAS